MKTFDKKTLKVLREDINKALEQVAQTHGIKIHAGNCSYDSELCTFKLGCQIEGALSQTEKDLEAELNYRLDSSFKLSLNKEKIGILDGKEYTLVGFKTRARKRPFIIQRLYRSIGKTGRQYVIDEATAEHLFGDNTLGIAQELVEVSAFGDN